MAVTRAGFLRGETPFLSREGIPTTIHRQLNFRKMPKLKKIKERFLKQKERYSKEMRLRTECLKPEWQRPCDPGQVGATSGGYGMFRHGGVTSPRMASGGSINAGKIRRSANVTRRGRRGPRGRTSRTDWWTSF